jgi:hypothetical protein
VSAREEPPAAFKARYVRWAAPSTQPVVLITFEVPVEKSDIAYQALGGMPMPSRIVECAIAVLKPDTEQQEPLRERKKFTELPLAQQTGILRKDPVFWAFLREAKGANGVVTEDLAVQWIHAYCLVKSCSEIPARKDATAMWERLVSEWQAWKFEDRVP